jgi:hypothetical protein
MPAPFLLPEPLLAKAAYELLAASSQATYERAVRRAAHTARELIAIGNAHTALSLIDAADRHWRELVSAKTRTADEFELSVLLMVLSEYADPKVDILLSRVAHYDKPPVAWPSALARNLLLYRPSNERSLLTTEADRTQSKVSPSQDNFANAEEAYPAAAAGWHVPSSRPGANNRTQLAA